MHHQEDGDQEVVSETILGCWLDHTRVCGPDCTAYDDRCGENPVFSPCLVLNIGRSMVVSLAGIEKSYAFIRKSEAQAELRKLANVEPPKV